MEPGNKWTESKVSGWATVTASKREGIVAELFFADGTHMLLDQPSADQIKRGLTSLLNQPQSSQV